MRKIPLNPGHPATGILIRVIAEGSELKPEIQGKIVSAAAPECKGTDRLPADTGRLQRLEETRAHPPIGTLSPHPALQIPKT